MKSLLATQLLQIEIEASEALLTALVKLLDGGDVAALSRDEAFELAALRYLNARALYRLGGQYLGSDAIANPCSTGARCSGDMLRPTTL